MISIISSKRRRSLKIFSSPLSEEIKKNFSSFSRLKALPTIKRKRIKKTKKFKKKEKKERNTFNTEQIRHYIFQQYSQREAHE